MRRFSGSIIIQPIETTPRYSNLLIHSTSPYLRQHAHNPVFWQPWGEEAFAQARAEDKPICLSIGYSTCYWCHVMEREVFTHPSIAALMNQHFVNIKVDREELPEVDAIYMMARQLMTSEGGWPNNVFLTPDLKPFYAGGTYGAREAYGKPSFPQLLEWIAYQWKVKREEMLEYARRTHEALNQLLIARQHDTPLPQNASDLTQELYDTLSARFDDKSGGFYKAPKFPHENYLLFLLEYYARTREERALYVASESLFSMCAGGIYDHVSSGFHRYAVDREWWVPHFEKMLYTQALCTRAYTELHRVTGSPYATTIACSTLDFTAAAMRSPEGAFYAAIDAETDGVEGAYYVWTAQELQTLLTPEEQAFFLRYYFLAELPHMPGHKLVDGQVIVAKESLWQAAFKDRQPYMMLEALSGLIFNKLLETRNKRKAPNMDDKIITGWNALMIEAYARASAVFNKPGYLEIASRAASYLLQYAMNEEGMLRRLTAKGIAQFDAGLEDYAYFIQALLMLYRVERTERWLQSALMLLGQADALMRDPEGGYFHTRARGDLIVRARTVEDSTLPSPNGVMLHNFIDLFELTGKQQWLAEAGALQNAFFPTLDRNMMPEYCTFLQGSLRLDAIRRHTGSPLLPATFADAPPVSMQATMAEREGKASLTLDIRLADGWYIYAPDAPPPLIGTQVEIFGPGVKEAGRLQYPYPARLDAVFPVEEINVFDESFTVTCEIELTEGTPRPPVYVTLRCQPCREGACAAPFNTLATL